MSGACSLQMGWSRRHPARGVVERNNEAIVNWVKQTEGETEFPGKTACQSDYHPEHGRPEGSW
jgi:hypothetical protein